MANAEQGAPPRRGAHVANATPRDGVGFGNPIARCVARTGRGKRRRVGRELQLAEHLADHLGLGEGGHDPERATAAQGPRGPSQSNHAPQEPGPAPGRGSRLRLLPVDTLLARRRDHRLAPRAMRRSTARITDKGDRRQGHDRCQLLSQCQRRQGHAGRAVRPRFGERVHAVSMGIFRKTLKCHGASCCIPHQALQLVTPRGWHLWVSVQGKPADTGAARTRECGTFPFITKP